MRWRNDSRARGHVHHDCASDGRVLSRPRERATVSRVEGAQGTAFQGKSHCSSPTNPPRKAETQSYHAPDVVMGILLALAIVTSIWGCGLAYQMGYEKARTFYSQEVPHGSN